MDERNIIGLSEKVLAEFSYCAKGFAYTWFEMADGEPVAVMGYDTEDQLLAAVAEAVSYGVKFERLF